MPASVILFLFVCAVVIGGAIWVARAILNKD